MHLFGLATTVKKAFADATFELEVDKKRNVVDALLTLGQFGKD